MSLSVERVAAGIAVLVLRDEKTPWERIAELNDGPLDVRIRAAECLLGGSLSEVSDVQFEADPLDPKNLTIRIKGAPSVEYVHVTCSLSPAEEL